jgi:Predicted Fe-S oxidoreductases
MKQIKSVCPECKKVLDSIVFEENGKIMLKKTCPEHGIFLDTYWSDCELYDRFSRYSYVGRGVSSVSTLSSSGCPWDCGICSKHKTGTLLANIDVTNRCNLNCPVCFANAKASGFIYEPEFEQIQEMMLTLRNQKPVPCYAVQFAGGEPTVREDLPEIIETALKLGFSQVQIATNGVRLAKSQEYCEALKTAGLHTVYLSFDGVSEEPYRATRGFNAFPVKQKVLENCRQTGLDSIVLVPTLIKGINDHQVGDIVRFAAKNGDIVKGVNFQPVAFAGRIDQSLREDKRITIPDLLALLEEQTEGEVPREAWYPASAAVPIIRFVSAVRKVPLPEFTIHPLCGAATYVFEEEGRLIPISEFVDVEGFLEFLESVTPEFEGKGSKVTKLAKVLCHIPHYIDNSKSPKDLNIVSLISNFLKNGTRENAAHFHRKALFLGAMHFQDLYNIDMERVEHCGIHYATPDGRIIPFCTYNNFHREGVEARYSKKYRKNMKFEKKSLDILERRAA